MKLTRRRTSLFPERTSPLDTGLSLLCPTLEVGHQAIGTCSFRRRLTSIAGSCDGTRMETATLLAIHSRSRICATHLTRRLCATTRTCAMLTRRKLRQVCAVVVTLIRWSLTTRTQTAIASVMQVSRSKRAHSWEHRMGTFWTTAISVRRTLANLNRVSVGVRTRTRSRPTMRTRTRTVTETQETLSLCACQTAHRKGLLLTAPTCALTIPRSKVQACVVAVISTHRAVASTKTVTASATAVKCPVVWMRRPVTLRLVQHTKMAAVCTRKHTATARMRV
mmetsp:Transcript_64316/g.155504  ORF Transcript_64316/g.155504 Transcript_64316/m.155504 type:complete len:279 (+) Transcript_64316:245-1081(+)